MPYKKIIILPALFILSTIAYIGCCKCDNVFDFYDYESFRVNAFGTDGVIIDSGTVTHTDTLYLQYTPQIKCVATAKDPLSFLGNETYACKCQECGRNGLKHKILSIKISADSIYNGIPAGSQLNNLFKAKIFSGGMSIGLDSLQTYLNTQTAIYAPVILYTDIKPGNNKGHIIKTEISFAGGKLISVSSKRFFWM